MNLAKSKSAETAERERPDVSTYAYAFPTLRKHSALQRTFHLSIITYNTPIMCTKNLGLHKHYKFCTLYCAFAAGVMKNVPPDVAYVQDDRLNGSFAQISGDGSFDAL